MLKVFLILALLPMCVAGCADLTSIGRRTSLPGGGEAIHLDAQQRLVYANGDGDVCAEPSPDAIQSIAASLGAGVAIPSEGAGSVSQAIEQSTGSIGLRTQSITLMRDALYRICEAAHNGTLKRQDVVQLLERSQDVTLGVLAIEQLTGAVVTRQVVLTGDARASSSADLANTRAQLDNAKRVEDQKKKALDDVTTRKNDDEAKLAAARQANPKDGNQITELTKKVNEDKAAVKAAEGDYNEAKETRQTIEQNFNSAVTSAQASATGGGHFETTSSGSKTIDKDTAEKIAGAVEYVVNQVVAKGHVTDTCINFLASYPTLDLSDQVRKTSATETFNLCKDIISSTLAVWKKNGGQHPFFVNPFTKL